MLKDPYHTALTAYELLELPLDATLPDVRDALKRFMRERGRKMPHLLAAAAQAQKKLQSSVARAELDIWFYDINPSGDAAEPTEALDLDEFSRPRVLAPSELYCDLTGADLEADQREITPRRMKVGDVRAFDDLENIRFTPRLDR